jgi:hypothetical protein
MPIVDEEKARFLSDPESRKYLQPFFLKDRSLKEASGLLGCSLQAIFYRVKIFEKAGLLKVVRREKRAGRAVKRYKTVSDVFFVPFNITPYAVIEENLFNQLNPRLTLILRGVARVLHAEENFGQYAYLGDDGTVWYTGSPPKGVMSVAQKSHDLLALDVSGDLELSFDEALALKKDLVALLDRYTKASGKKGVKAYTYAVLFSPTPPES